MIGDGAPINKQQQEIVCRHLRKMDMDFLDIILVVPKICAYRFQDEWMEMGIEGSLYLYGRRGTPACRLVVLNRKSLNDLKMDVSGYFKCEPKGRFVILSSKRTTFGLWFDDEEGANVLLRTLEGLQKRWR